MSQALRHERPASSTDQAASRHATPAAAAATKSWSGQKRFAAMALLTASMLLFGNGCSMFYVSPEAGEDEGAATPLEPLQDAPGATAGGVFADPIPPKPKPTGGSNPADLMFTDTAVDTPPPPSGINVFGEVDGVSPSAHAPTGKSGFTQNTFVDEGYDSDVCVSADGKTLLFASTRHCEQPDIYVQGVDGLAVTQITSDPADDAFPTFSPDGRRIAFASSRAGNWDIYLMDLDGSNVEQITRSAAQEIHPSFSPDAAHIAYCAMGARSGQWEIWLVDLRSMERRMIGYGLFPEWSPRTDKDQIVFQRARQRGTRWFSAWTMDVVNGEARNLTEVAFSTNAAIVAPTWSPDGARIAFSTISDPAAANPGSAAGRIKGTQQDVWVVNADGSGRRRLTDGRGVNATPCWSSDNRVYFVSDRSGSESIWSVAVGRNDTQTAGAEK